MGNGIWAIKWSRDRWRHVTPKVLWGSTVGYPSDSLASCCYLVTLSSVYILVRHRSALAGVWLSSPYTVPTSSPSCVVISPRCTALTSSCCDVNSIGLCRAVGLLGRAVEEGVGERTFWGSYAGWNHLDVTNSRNSVTRRTLHPLQVPLIGVSKQAYNVDFYSASLYKTSNALRRLLSLKPIIGLSNNHIGYIFISHMGSTKKQNAKHRKQQSE